MNLESSIERWYKNGVCIDCEAYDALDDTDGWEYREIELDVTFDGNWVNDGIGYNEYWGIPGVDSHWGFVVEDLDSAVDKDGKDWIGDMTADEYQRILEECMEYGAEEYPRGG